ncbi:hypothetical protein [Pseudoduganella lutea]|uniref:Lipoprotein n=1 Tax=Pseudoduganella lutea TaxID=321985 RepID=A0A4V0Z364_9BURK|nr:hypothetical protein [Pseudoduganella lutea]QBE62353.1 hypothetical protein EWM63_04620 [Pseudoduganella lutea]
MKSVFATALAACMLLACSPKADEEPAEAPPDSTPTPALQRLVGTLSITEDYAIAGKSGAPFLTRKMVLQGKIDQVVQVEESGDSLDVTPEGGAPMRMSGTISETGQLSMDNPDSNSIVKTRGDSTWTGKLGDYELRIARSKLGVGDEIHLRFNMPMDGNMVVKSTHTSGAVTEMGTEGNLMGLSLLEANPSDGKFMFKRDYDLFPKLGQEPTEAFEKQLYDGMKKFPAVVHLGAVTNPGRNAWTYAGTKVYSKPGSETQWTEKVELSFKLVPR